MGIFDSRFFVIDDPTTKELVYRLPDSWWSRFYEYEWSRNFVDKADVVLDAASGVIHPLQFFLADHCKEVSACDNDERILSEKNMIEMARKELGEESQKLMRSNYFERIKRSCCSITKLPYEDGKFDKIYCISVLEHLKDWFNKKNSRIKYLNILGAICRRDIYEAMKEFKRVLKNNGLIILTFDYPDINLEYLNEIVSRLGLEFAGEKNFKLPENALSNEAMGLYCFRAVLRKTMKNGAEVAKS